MRIWYLVADGARARLFKTDRRDGDLEETDTYVNEKGRLRDRDFETDRAGRSFKGGSRRTAMGDEDSPSEREEEKFAKRLADMLNDAHRDGEFEQLGIIAAPAALGRIREELDDRVLGAIIGSSSKNLTEQSASQIRDHIADNVIP